LEAKVARTKRLKLSPEEVIAKRTLIRQWMDAHQQDEASFADFLDYSPLGVRVNLGDPTLKTRRDPAFDFLRRVQERTGLPLLSGDSDQTPAMNQTGKLDDELTDRIVLFLSLTGIATARQLAQLVGKTVSTFNRWIPDLVDQGVIAQASERYLEGNHSPLRILALGRTGARRATRLLGRVAPSPVAHGELKADIPVRHNLSVTDIALRAFLELGPQLVDWAADAACRARLTRMPGRQCAEPDLFLVIRDALGDHACWVEYETGTAGRQAVSEKSAAMDAYVRNGSVQVDWHTGRLRILWVAQGDEHARQLREWIGPCRPYVHHWFTSLSAIREHGIKARIWYVVNGRENLYGLFDDVGRPIEQSQGGSNAVLH
jgi:hypothetical protein